MKKNYITLLLTLFMFLVPYFLLGKNPEGEQEVPSECKIAIKICVPSGTMGENLKKQLKYLEKITVIVNEKNQLSQFSPYTDKTKQEISHWLFKSSELEKDDCYKNYLITLSENIKKRNYFYVDLPQWADLEGNRLEIVFPRDVRYMNGLLTFRTFFSFIPKMFNWRDPGIFNTVIYLNQLEETRKFQEYTDIFPKMQDNLPYNLVMPIAYSLQSPSFKISQLIFSSTPFRFTLIYPDTITGPSSNETDEEKSFKIVVFKNLVKAFFEGVVKPISGQVLAEERLWDVDYDSYISNLIMRRISHHLGPVFIIRDLDKIEEDEKKLANGKFQKRKPKQKKKKKIEKELRTIPEILKDLFPVIEALKSQLIAIHNTSVLIKNGLISEDKDINIYTTHLVSLICQLRKIPVKEKDIDSAGKIKLDNILGKKGSENFMSALIQFNSLMEDDGIIFNINNRKLNIDRLIFTKTIKKLTSEILKLLSKATLTEAKQYLYSKITFPPQLKEILKSIEDIPLTVELQLEWKE